jgi:hypothetical protein
LSDPFKGEPAKGPLNSSKTSPSDIKVTGAPADEKSLARTLEQSLKQVGQATYKTKR